MILKMIDHEFDLIQKVSDELCLVHVVKWMTGIRICHLESTSCFQSESFGENAAKTLSEDSTYIGEKQPCIIGGYSLAGLFAL